MHVCLTNKSEWFCMVNDKSFWEKYMCSERVINTRIELLKNYSRKVRENI